MLRKIIVFTLVFTVLAVVLCGCVREVTPESGYLRIHIRANSDSSCDQEMKLAVRDSLVGYFSPILKGVNTAKDAESVILSKTDEIECAVNELLYSCGYFYGCRVRIDTEYFEEREYENLVLRSGYYRAVILELGQGVGKNWWCVAFPPLCFSGEDYDNVTYKSILKEIIDKYSKGG